VTPGRPAARPAGLYVHRPTKVQAMVWTGDNLAEACTFFNRVLHPVHMPGLGPCVPLVSRCGTVYAAPGDVLVMDGKGRLYPVPDSEFAVTYRLKEEHPA
jgi:hypothetical protein